MISVGGVAFAVMLILVLEGLYLGWQKQLGAYLESINTDFWIGQEGTGDMSHSLSILPETTKNQLEEIEGVTKVSPFYARQTTVKIEDKEGYLRLIGFDPDENINGPVEIKEGSRRIQSDEIIVDDAFVQEHRLRLGDKLKIMDQDFKIAGISTKGSMLSFQFAFIREDKAKELFKLPGLVNFYLVQTDPDYNQEILEKRIKDQISGIEVFSKQEFIDKNTALIRESFLPIILVLVVIGFLIGTAVVGLTIYTATIEKSREYGILKAIGASNRQLYAIIIEQSFWSGITGFLVGIILAFFTSNIAQRFETGFITYYDWTLFAWVFVATMLMSLIAALLPIRKIAKIDPAVVFRA